MEPIAWTCPFCGRDATVGDRDVWNFSQNLPHASASGPHILMGQYVVCPNPKCKRFTLFVMLYQGFYGTGGLRLKDEKPVGVWQLVPASDAKPFPEYIPQQIRRDYEEACLIRDLSPKSGGYGRPAMPAGYGP